MSDSDEELAEVERQMSVLRAAKQTALQKAPPKPYDPRAESSDDDEPGPGTRLAPAGVSKYLAETNRKDIASAKSKVRMANKHGRVPVAGDPDEDAMWADLLQGLSLGKFSSASPFRRQCAQIIFSKYVHYAPATTPLPPPPPNPPPPRPIFKTLSKPKLRRPQAFFFFC